MNISTQFLSDYRNYLTHINKFIKEKSGTHSIDLKQATKWINAQPNATSKRAAQIIIDYTVYVTLEETAQLAKNLIDTYYREIIEKNPNKTIYFVAGDNKKSNYWLSILALSYIREFGLKEPDYYYYFIDHELMENSNNVFIYFDDMSYSGGQIYHFLEEYISKKLDKNIKNHLGTASFEFQKANINTRIQQLEKDLSPKPELRILRETLAFIKDKSFSNLFESKFEGINPNVVNTYFSNYSPEALSELQPFLSNIQFPHLYILLIGINQNSYDKLTAIKYKISNQTSIIKPFNVYYGKMFKSVDDLINENQITEEELFYMSYYFSLHMTPNVLMYFDHKIADEPSTFLRAYNYGCIVPENYDIVNYYPYYVDSLNNDYSQKTFVREKYFMLFKKYYTKREKPVLKQDIYLPLQFIPFIKNCYNVNAIIQNPLMKFINYYAFIGNIFVSTKEMSKKEIILNILNSKYEADYMDKVDMFYLILKSFTAKHINIYINGENMQENLPTNDKGDVIEIENIDLSKYNLDAIDQFNKVYKFIAVDIRENRCELSFYKKGLEKMIPTRVDKNSYDTYDVMSKDESLQNFWAFGKKIRKTKTKNKKNKSKKTRKQINKKNKK